jgi:hypothetical protein
MTKREVVIFFAGVEAFHTLSHLTLHLGVSDDRWCWEGVPS